MTEVVSLTPFTCGLACVESICFDFGLEKRQEDFLRDYKSLLLGIGKIEHFGSTNPFILKTIIKSLGFDCHYTESPPSDSRKKFFDNFDHSKSAIIIFAHIQQKFHHTFRFSNMTEKEELKLLDPNFVDGPKSSNYSFQTMENWNYSLLYVHLKS
jgi:hypothetical protein